ncbi:MAG: histidine kinase dimerization/phospho-acceptor domain-containing protein, partial [Isosphaeraceae bacterium]|nr:histidine kinase dimerization/phospho-acceptor domain-containing protein [Isosphaeraceae bacterium]
MPSPTDAGQPAVSVLPAHVVLAGEDVAWLEQAAVSLEQQGYRVSRTGEPARALSLLRDARPDLVVVDGTAGGPVSELREPIRAGGLPVLVVLDAVPDPGSWLGAYGEASDWVLRPNVRTELSARAGCLLSRSRQRAGATPRVPADARFFSLVIHDLRTPLNVIGLSLRMIGQAVPKGDPELDEDLRFVEENFKQIERMLAQLSDYFRLSEAEDPLYITEFSPEILLGELLENRALKPGPKGPSLRLDVQATCPRAVALDQSRARLALQHALANALAAAGDGTLVTTLRGQPGRWIIEIATDRPAPSTVQPTVL